MTSVYLAGIQRNAAGRMFALPGAVPASFVNGIPVTTFGQICFDDGGDIASFSGGIPLTAEGRLATLPQTPPKHWKGSWPFTGEGRLALLGADPLTFSNGLGLAAGGSLAITLDDPPDLPVPPGLPRGPELFQDVDILGTCGGGLWVCGGGAAIAAGQLDTGENGNANVNNPTSGSAGLYTPFAVTLDIEFRPGQSSVWMQIGWGGANAQLNTAVEGIHELLITPEISSGFFTIQGLGSIGVVVNSCSVKEIIIEPAGNVSTADLPVADPLFQNACGTPDMWVCESGGPLVTITPDPGYLEFTAQATNRQTASPVEEGVYTLYGHVASNPSSKVNFGPVGASPNLAWVEGETGFKSVLSVVPTPPSQSGRIQWFAQLGATGTSRISWGFAWKGDHLN